MKRFMALFMVFLLLSPLPAHASDTEDCISAAAGMMDYLAEWQQSNPLPFLSDEESAASYLAVFGGAAEQLAGRLTYRMGNAKVSGNTAMVDLTVSAVDVSEAAGGILLQAAGYLVVQRLYGSEIDLNGYLSQHLVNIIDTLPAITTHTTVYLILGGDGAWKVDVGNEKNLAFLNALSGGGFLACIEAVQNLVALYTPSSEQ